MPPDTSSSMMTGGSEPVNTKETGYVPQTKEEFNTHVAHALNDAVLPSKSPLPENDPFNFLTSPKFVTTFLTASSVLVFMLSLFE